MSNTARVRRLTPEEVAAIAARAAMRLPLDGPPGAPTGTPRSQDGPGASQEALDADPLLRALHVLGLVQGGPRASPMGPAYDIECPWAGEHTGRATSGTVYVPVRTKFRCHHGHCDGRTHEHLRLEVDRLLREDSGGALALVHFEFDPVDPDTLPPPGVTWTSPEARFLNDTIYVSSATRQKFWSVSRRIQMDDDALAERWRVALHDVLPDDPRSPANKPRKMTPGQWYRVHDRRRAADGWIKWPGGGVLVQWDGQTLVNTWTPVKPWPKPDRPVTDQDIAPWLALVHHVLGRDTLEEGETLETILDWMAMVAGSWVKPGWHPVVTSDTHGLGKDAILLPLAWGLEGMAEEVRSTDFADPHNTWAACRLLHVQEMKQTTRGTTTAHDTMNTLKQWDNTREVVWINPKNRPRMPARNVFAMWITSNEKVPLRLEPTDRRFVIIDRHGVPENKALIKQYIDAGDKGWVNEVDPGTACKGWHLVHAWLIQRWADMPVQCRRVLSGRAPMTQAKADMIEASVDEIEAWMRRGVDAEPPSPGAWPPVVSSMWVHARLVRAIKAGDEGISPRVTIPNLSQVGNLLLRAGATKLNNGTQLRINGERLRHWAVRDGDLYAGLNPTELRKIIEKMGPGRGMQGFDA